MSSFVMKSEMPVDQRALFTYHAAPGAIRRLTPPWLNARVIEEPASLQDGARAVVSMPIGPFRQRLVAEHFDYIEGEQFCDRQVSGPFRRWSHRHRFEASSKPGRSVLVDEIDYALPLAPVSSVVAGRKIARDLAAAFRFRHARTRFDLLRQAHHRDRPSLTVAVTGATGAVGSTLIPFLTVAGYRVRRIVRGEAKTEEDIAWNPETGEIDADKIGTCDVIVHLAGKNIATRWTTAAKKVIRDSRVDATRKLCEALARLSRRPSVMIAGSAIGFYGDRGDEVLTESSPPGDNWQAKLCVDWEAATDPARQAGIRVVNLRTGIVLSARHGALAKLLTPTRFGVAGRVGSGEQWMPWIAMEDEIGVIYEAIQQDAWQGPVNAVTGNVRQIDFMKTLGRVVRRPTIVPMPAAGVNVLFGQMGRELLLGSTRVEPAVLKASGFEWMLPSLESALRYELGRMDDQSCNAQNV